MTDVTSPKAAGMKRSPANINTDPKQSAERADLDKMLGEDPDCLETLFLANTPFKPASQS